jgi:DNA polymerase III delta prime subunit
MSETYFVHSNRQHQPDITFPKQFEELGVAATFGPREYGEQLEILDSGDRILLYDQPSGQYIAVGVVTEPWDGSTIADPEHKVTSDDDVDEYHASVDWDQWYSPENGFDRETVNRALGYQASYAPPRAVSTMTRPDDDTVDRVYSALVSGETLGPLLTPEQKNVLEKWRIVAQTEPAGTEFDFVGHNRTDEIADRADAFIADPSSERFERMWNRMHSAIQRGQAGQILNKWDGSITDLADLIEEIRDADSYDPDWEDTLGGKTTVRELFGSLHIDDHPILNAAAAQGLVFFGYDEPRSYAQGEQYFSELLETYNRVVGHATHDADHGVTVPIRFEVDQLFNIIDKIDEQSLETEQSETILELYEAILATEETSRNEDASVYWVNQRNVDELEEEYLEAPIDDHWSHDLTVLDVGDTAIHYRQGNVVGRSTVTDEAYRIEQDGTDRYRVDVKFERFKHPRPIDDVREYLMRDDVRGEKYYPLDSNGKVNQTYLSRLTDVAAEYLLDTPLDVEAGGTFEDYNEALDTLSDGATVDKGPLYFPDSEWERIQSRIRNALESGNHVLLFGPPGTGKTKLARQVCEGTVGEDNYELVTASADWSTFDTVGGYQTTAKNILEFQPGVVLDRFQAKADSTPTNEWLVIDELNRADIDKAFGSLFSALTGESVTLPFNGSEGDPIEILDASQADAEVSSSRFYIPEDWRMLATMNTLDKTSLYEMSYAFMRRWAFVPVGIPDLPEPETDTPQGESALEELVGAYVSVWAADGSVPAAEHHYEPIGRIWHAVKDKRAIGPAIVEDIYEYVVSAETVGEADYISPIIMYLFPQLEGLRRSEIELLLSELDSIVDEDSDELWATARDFFQLDLQPGSE